MSTAQYEHLTPGEKESPARPRFYMDKELMTADSDKAGKQIWRDVEMVEIIVPGDSKNIWAGRVKDEHRFRWPGYYEAFKKGQEPPQYGYPIKEWPALTPAQVANFQALNIHTVEALAQVPDNLLQHLGMGAFQTRDKAQKWLAVQKDAEVLNQVMAERDASNAARDATQRQLDDLQARLGAMERAQTPLAPGGVFNGQVGEFNQARQG